MSALVVNQQPLGSFVTPLAMSNPHLPTDAGHHHSHHNQTLPNVAQNPLTLSGSSGETYLGDGKPLQPGKCGQGPKKKVRHPKVQLTRPTDRTWRWVYRCKTHALTNPHLSKFTGVGKFTWQGGSYYEGEWAEGLPDGKGVKYWDEKECYKGSWKLGKMHGFGKYIWPDGASYEGEWEDGFHHGRGLYLWADGNQYEGGWKRGHREGFGVRTWVDGDVFEGEWVEGKRTGKGTYYWPNGSKFVGEWRNGAHHGYGIYTWLDGRRRFRRGP